MYKDREEPINQAEYIKLMDPDSQGFWYLSGPMRGIDEFNFPAFQLAASRLRNVEALNIYSPADFDLRRGFDPSLPLEQQPVLFDYSSALLSDLEAIRIAKGVVVLPGWGNSPGARTEVEYAQAIGLPVRKYVGEGEVALGPLVPSRRSGESSTAELAAGREVDVDEVDKAFIEIDEYFENLTRKVFEENKEVLEAIGEDEEVRVTSESGGMKGKKLAQMGSIDPISLYEVSQVSGMGAEKYEKHNYRKGYDWSLSYDAMQRHLMWFWAGYDNDEESGLPHMAHAAWHALALLSFIRDHPEYDDRFKD